MALEPCTKVFVSTSDINRRRQSRCETCRLETPRGAHRKSLTHIVHRLRDQSHGQVHLKRSIAHSTVLTREMLRRNAGPYSTRAAVVVCAPAVTGANGMENAWETSKVPDDAVSETANDRQESLVMSDRVIGQHLQIPGSSRAIAVRRVVWDRTTIRGRPRRKE